MKLFVLGLDCAAPELLFGDERLVNFRRLMEAGCHGRLESVVPPITVPAWMCMATGQDPGTLGVYGFRNRADYSYGPMQLATSRSITAPAVWDQVARQGKRSVVIGVPPGYPPREIDGIFVGCCLTPDTTRNEFTHPAAVRGEIEQLLGGPYPADVKGFRTEDKDWLREQILATSRRQFAVVRHFVQTADWDYFEFVEIGLDRIQHGFWRYHDPLHRAHVPGNPYQGVVRDYYRHLDEELGRLLEILPDETAVLVASDHGAQRLDGGFCINQWLVDEGLLVLHHRPSEPTPLERLDVDWSKTGAWGEGGYYARIFLNVAGREPQGVIARGDYERVRDELKSRLEATTDDAGRPLGTAVFRPEELYREVRGIPPDLIVHFGGLRWRSIEGVGYPTIYTQGNDTGPDDCNHAPFGAFVLAAPGSRLAGQIEGFRLLDVAPTLLELGGYDPLPAACGAVLDSATAALAPQDEQAVRERLRGLGYI